MKRAPVIEQQDARAIRTDEGDGEVGDPRIADQQADIQRGDDAVNIIRQEDVRDGVVEDRHGRRDGVGQNRPDGVQGKAEDGADVNRDGRGREVADADPVGADLQRRQIGLVNGHLAADERWSPRCSCTAPPFGGQRSRVKSTGPVAETTATVMLRLVALAGTSMKSSRQALPWMVAIMPAARKGLLVLEEDPETDVGADVTDGIIHHAKHPLALTAPCRRKCSNCPAHRYAAHED